MAVSPTLLNTAMLRWLDELSGQGVFITDTELVVRGWNRWLERFTGLPSANVIGQPLLQLFPDLAMRGLAAHYRAALSGEVSVLSHRLHGHLLRMPQPRKDGGSDPMPQSARIAPLIDGGQVVGTITVIDDVSERVTSELELRRQIAEAERARRQAEEASRVERGIPGDPLPRDPHAAQRGHRLDQDPARPAGRRGDPDPCPRGHRPQRDGTGAC